MMGTVTITEFLLARIAEDEAAARAAAEHRTSLASHPELGFMLSADGPAGELWTCKYDTVNATHEDGHRAGGIAYVGNFGMALVGHIARWDPSRVLAECEAKRRIVEAHAPVDNDPDGWCTVCDGDGWPCATMSALASVYADHPDFDPAWRLAD